MGQVKNLSYMKSMNTLEYRLFYERHLPHFQPPDATLFITSRLAGSIPMSVLQELLAEAERNRAKLARITDSKERAQQADLFRRQTFGRWDNALDKAANGPFWLREPKVAALVTESLHHLHDRVYELEAFCIMPNHMHLVFTPLQKADGRHYAMSSIMHSLKRHTARKANLLLKREGTFWQHENYDHVIRNAAEQERIIKYVVNNPVSAGLAKSWEDWEWTYCKHEL